MVRLFLTWRWHCVCLLEVSSSRVVERCLDGCKKIPEEVISSTSKDFLGISAKESYTPSNDPPGVVYQDLRNRKRLMQADELYKFSDETLKKFPDVGEEDHKEHGKISWCTGTRDGLQANAEDADMFTKSLSHERFEYLIEQLGMRCLTTVELEVLANETA
ncbi:hypothetical protein Tco_0961755 [Tanacetum coccineum]